MFLSFFIYKELFFTIPISIIALLANKRLHYNIVRQEMETVHMYKAYKFRPHPV